MADPMQQARELLPCPFCGGEAERIDFGPDAAENEGGSCIACRRCQASGPVEFGFKENFIANWNTRAALRAAPEGFVMVPIAEVASALDVVRDAMECAYHNRFPECCGQYSPSGCCGNPREAWSKEDQSIMDALHPAEQALTAMLAARPQEQVNG